MTDLQHTPLFALHEELGAKMVPFAGYAMPVQYPMGVMQEHQHTRTQAGLFDVSHMGQVILSGADWDSVALAFETLVPMDVLGLGDGRQRYGLFTNAQGGIEDDLMFARRGDALFVVVNAACKDADIARMRAGLPDTISVGPLEDRALLALQGPQAEAVMAGLDPAAAAMRFMDVADLTLDGIAVWASRSGYTGEDGYEISVPADQAEALARVLLAHDAVAPIGLGARDSLRLEAGLCLYGNDIDAGTDPVEAGLVWAIQKVRREGGARAGGFPGAEAVLHSLHDGPARKRVGLRPEGRAPMRDGVALYASETAELPVGTITSGGFGPTVGGPVAMGYVPDACANEGTQLWGALRGKRLPVTVVKLPFVPANFKR
ncbi:glycine cleavage system aminomethyltransferase GcvT [Sulfitobacter sabulilitoris]|uniref:aminomethyltransferase n=1 Tax=Sulfitobacter sabulilitoris TaxID=2562655 RepID=A0A5S3PBR9_9RHOB|nr:glycine cleavage system aminomethyltransferase GcvT [Sulfitobacter sabulilitoris]TMM51132.1 glycine cleavage system aminomethyltransferase GcvT [Sulfitobacter sabulilitoris]